MIPRTTRLPAFRFQPKLLAVVLHLGLSGMLTVGGISPAMAQSAARQQYDIPAGPLDLAITRFAQQAGVAISFEAGELKGMQTTGLHGSYGVDEGFALLLRDSGYAIGKTAAGYVLVPAAKPAHPALPEKIAELPLVEVQGGKELGYVAPVASTATKTDTPVMETPMTVNVIPQQILQEQGTPSLGQALAYAGVYGSGNEPSTEMMYYRGFVSSATLWNGFRISEPTTINGGAVGGVWMGNVDRLEVIKGPASILYGQSEPGGMVNVITKQPRDKFHGSVQAGAGSWSNKSLSVDLTGPVDQGNTLLYRINASDEISHSWLKWAPNYHSTAVAPVLEWRLSPQTKLSVEGQFRYLRGMTGASGVPVDPATGQIVPASPSLSLLPNTAGEYDQSRYSLGLEHRFDENWSLSLKRMFSKSYVPSIQWQYITNATFPATPGQLMVDGFLLTTTSNIQTDATMLDLSGHFSALGVKHTVLFGADDYAQHYRYAEYYSCCSTTNYYSPATFPLSAFQNGTLYAVNDEFAGLKRDSSFYLQDQMELPRDWHLLLGARYQKYSESSASNGQIGTPLVAKQPILLHKFLPRFGLLWRPQPWLSTYYSYAENFGSSNIGFTFAGTPLKPETAKQHEIGVKTEWMDGRLNSSLAVFNLTKFNISAADPVNPTFNINIGEVRSTGFEFNLQGELTPNWNALANYSYARPYVVQGASNIVTGQLLPGVPEKTANIWSSYRLTNGWKIGGGANWASSATP